MKDCMNCGRTLSYEEGSPCSKCRRYGADNDPTQWIPAPVLWGDKIRSMNDEELGQFLVSFSVSVDFPYSSARSAMLRGEIVQWLKQEVKL